jgi:cysteine desulfurase / selenocysteine lyase
VHGRHPLVYLDNAASTQRPRQVIDTLREVYEHQYANVHRGIHYLSELSTDLYEQSRETVQQFMGAAQSHEVIFTTGTTAGINLVARSWCDAFLSAGDEILLTEMEHHSNIVPWQQAAARTGARVRFLPLTPDGQLRLDDLDAWLTERTKVLAVSAVSNVMGTINPVRMLVSRAREVGAMTLVDAAQSVPHEPLDVQELGADFVVFSGHKMLGPSGIGILYGRETCLDKMPPFLGGGSMIRKVTWDGFEPASLPFKFEAGTPPIADAIALSAAVTYLQELGLERIAQHERWLVSRTHDLMNELGDIEIFGPAPKHKGGIVSFNLRGLHPHDVAELLDQQGVAIRAGHHCAMPLHERLGQAATARASFYLYNTVEEVERLGEALRIVRQTLQRRSKPTR